MDCSVCLENFDDEIVERRPYLINPCGHCFCLSCLQSFNPPNCPKCRAFIENKVCNWQLVDVISENKAKKQREKINSFDFDLFISFQFDFKHQAKIFHEKLEIACFHSNKEIKLYRDEFEIDKSNHSALTEKIVKKIKNCRIFVCFLTKKYIESVNCIKEFEFAHSIGKKVLPICIEKIDIDQLNLLSIYNHKTINCFDQTNYNTIDWLNLKFDSILRSIQSKLKVNQN